MNEYKIKDLSFSYPDSINKELDKVSLIINQGEFVTICGKSGSGKSTLLKHLKTELTPHGTKCGEIYFLNKALKDVNLREQSQKIGFVMQNPDNQIVTDKVWHELAFGLESLSYNQKVIRLRVAEMASYFGIQNWFYKKVCELSGGQKQLLNLASVMAIEPEVLILDEPTSQLDPIAASDFINTIRKINLEFGTTIIIVEHHLDEVFQYSDKVVVMDRGKIIANASPQSVGNILRESNHDMLASLPIPAQIFYSLDSKEQCPLNVNEGRKWIERYVENNKISYKTDKVDKEILCKKDVAISLKDVWFRYSKGSQDVLKGVTLEVPVGVFYAIVGGNGTGKTSMLKSICKINKTYRGRIKINGKDINKYKGNELFNNCLAMLPQDPQCIFVKKTVREELYEMFSIMQRKSLETEKFINEVVELTEIKNLLNRHPYDLSGGEQQKAALAKILLNKPKIILLDEPTKGIDSYFKIKLAKILKNLVKTGVTVLMVSHDIEFCAQHAEIASMFFDGSIVTTNRIKEFFENNCFYTTIANRMCRNVLDNVITSEEVINRCMKK